MDEQQILKIVEKARRNTELSLKRGKFSHPEDVFNREIKEQFDFLNSSNSGVSKQNPVLYVSKDVKIKEIQEKKENHSSKKIMTGSALVLAGQPLIKKRFVTRGASLGTSLASKYLSKVFPQKMPVRILGTRVFGRAIGRAVPYVGWALVVVDVIELIIEEVESESHDSASHFNGFGGSFGGGGAESYW